MRLADRRNYFVVVLLYHSGSKGANVGDGVDELGTAWMQLVEMGHGLTPLDIRGVCCPS